MENLEGRIALVTGASRGLGPTIALALARQGVQLALAARSQERLDAVASRITAITGVRAIGIPADVTSAGHREALVERAARELGPIDILVNNAGIERTEPFERSDPAAIASIIETNLVAPMLLTRALLPGMLERGRGHIVNVSSLAGKVGVPFEAPYCASKSGLIQFTESLRFEFAGRGVSASVVCPGFVGRAGMYANTVRETGVTASRLAGISTPADVARAVVRSIRHDIPEIIVNPGPMRLISTLAELSPRLFELGYGLFGTKEQFGQVAARRTQGVAP